MALLVFFIKIELHDFPVSVISFLRKIFDSTLTEIYIQWLFILIILLFVNIL